MCGGGVECERWRFGGAAASGRRRGERAAAWSSGGDGGLDLERERRRCD